MIASVIRWRGSRARRAATLGALSLAAGLLLAAGPARAGDDFERGFKNELGRIAAHEAVSAGLHILGGIFYPVYRHPGPPGYGAPGHRHHRHHKHHKHRYYGYGYGDGHGYRYEPCEYERYERYERRRGGFIERYEEHEYGYPYRERVRYDD